MALDYDKVIVPKLGIDNYATWAPKMRFLLVTKGLWAAVETAGTGEDSQKAFAQIGLHVEDYHLSTVTKCTSAKEAWEALQSVYESTSLAQVLMLKKELSTLAMRPKEPVTKYIARATSLQEQLTTAKVTTEERDIVLAVLAGLPKDYDMLVTVLENSGTTLTLKDVMAKLLLAEQRNGINDNNGNSSETALLTNANAFRRPGATGGRPSGNNNNRRETRECYYCHRQGHLSRDCRKKKHDNERHGTARHDTTRPRPGFNGIKPTIALTATASGFTDDMWIIDSGASRHITHCVDKLVAPVIPEAGEGSKISYGNGSSGSATAMGTVVLLDSPSSSRRLVLQDVLYEPSAQYNLLSVSSAVAKGASFDFQQQQCNIFVGSDLVAVAEAYNDVYVINSRAAHPAMALVGKATEQTAELWHRRLAHLGYDNIKRLTTMSTGINVTNSNIQTASTVPCEPCFKGKQTRLPFPTSETVTNKPLELVHMDLCGPMPVESLGGSRYIATFIDDYSSLSLVRLLKRKDDMKFVISEVFTYLEVQAGRGIKAARTDNGGEYVNAAIDAYFKTKGIKHQTTVPYTPEQNGKAERLNLTLLDKVRCMLADANQPNKLWGEAVSCANYLRNRSPVAGKDRTPVELFTGVAPDLSNLRTFGATAYVHVPKEKRTKLDFKSETGFMVGYGINTKGYRIYLGGSRVVTARDVVFDERPAGVKPGFIVHDNTSDDNSGGDGNGNSDNGDDSGPDNDRGHDNTDGGNNGNNDSDPGSPPPAPRKSSRPTIGKKPGEWWKATKAPIISLSAATQLSEPLTREEALRSADAEQWQQAMADEMASLLANNSWTLEKVPKGINPIPVKWVFKIKRDSAGNVERYKARLVAKGFRQQEGIDYNEVFAPVSKYSTLRVLMAKVAAEDLEMHQLDIKTAFLQGNLEEDIFICQPPGYEQGDSSMACHLHKALYGLKQAPRAWYQRLHEELTNLGFVASSADPGLYINMATNGNDSIVYILVYVDDIMVVAKRIADVTGIKSQLLDIFDGRDLGAATTYLGISINRDRASRTIKLSHKLMTTELVASNGLEEGNPRTLPLSTSVNLTATDGEPLEPAYLYRQLVGSLMHLSVTIRPDIAYAVGALARFMAAPTTAHWQAAKGVLRYLAGTPDYGISFGKSDFKLDGYCDADYAGDIDTRRSTTGYVFTLGGGAIAWQSKRQQTVAVSTTEAEYMAAAAAVKEGLWLRKLLQDLNISSTEIIIMADNQSAIKLLRNPISSVRSKHIDVMHHFARERVLRKEVAFKYISTDKMVADIFTKALPGNKHKVCCLGMGVF